MYSIDVPLPASKPLLRIAAGTVAGPPHNLAAYA
jgi:hypothetical protein